MMDLDTRLNRLAAWQYLNAATFICVVIILVILLV
jgi:hypothetical protein